MKQRSPRKVLVQKRLKRAKRTEVILTFTSHLIRDNILIREGGNGII